MEEKTSSRLHQSANGTLQTMVVCRTASGTWFSDWGNTDCEASVRRVCTSRIRHQNGSRTWRSIYSACRIFAIARTKMGNQQKLQKTSGQSRWRFGINGWGKSVMVNCGCNPAVLARHHRGWFAKSQEENAIWCSVVFLWVLTYRLADPKRLLCYSYHFCSFMVRPFRAERVSLHSVPA